MLFLIIPTETWSLVRGLSLSVNSMALIVSVFGWTLQLKMPKSTPVPECMNATAAF